jgi:hypothetical protein
MNRTFCCNWGISANGLFRRAAVQVWFVGFACFGFVFRVVWVIVFA